MSEKFYYSLFFVSIGVSNVFSMNTKKIEKDFIIENHFSVRGPAPLKPSKNYYERMELANAKKGIFEKTFQQEDLCGGMEKIFAEQLCQIWHSSSYITCARNYFSVVMGYFLSSKETDSSEKKMLKKNDNVAPSFDWENPCKVEQGCKYIAGYKKYLYKNKYDLKIYDIHAQKNLLETKAGQAGWSEDYSCFYTIQQHKNQDFIVKIYDFKTNKNISLPCKDDLSFTHIFTCGSRDDIRFMMQVDNLLHITNIRDNKTKIIGVGDEDVTIKTLRIYDSSLWVHYNKNETNNLVVYDMLDDCKILKIITAKESIQPVLNPYGSSHIYAVWCIDDCIVVFNSKNADELYCCSQKMKSTMPLVCLWNYDKSMFALSQLKKCTDVTVHTLPTKSSTVLALENNTTLVADIGFQDGFLAVSNVSSKGNVAAVEIYDTITGKKVAQATSKTIIKDYGFCTRNCIFINSYDRFFIYNFKEDEVLVNVYHNGIINKISKNKKYCLVSADCDEIILIAMLDNKSQGILRNAKIINAWFDVYGEKYIAIAYDTTVEIIDINSLETVSLINAGFPVEHIVFNHDVTLCAAVVNDKKTILVYDVLHGEKPLATMSYATVIDLENVEFSRNEESDDESKNVIFVVPTNSFTYIYTIKK